MNLAWKLLIGTLFAFAAVACSADAELEDMPPTAAPESTLPTAVSPDTIQEGTWAIPFTYEFPEGTWGVGFHRYAVRVDCPVLSPDGLAGEWQDFVATNDIPLLRTPVYLRLGGLSTSTLGPPNVQNIHPDQFTIAVVTIIGVTEEQAALAAESDDCSALVAWDGSRIEELSPAEPYRP